jgi:hypothetical protein
LPQPEGPIASLAGQEFPFVFGHVHPEKAEARNERAVRNSQIVAATGTEEVEFVVSDEVSALPIPIHTHAQPRVLRTKRNSELCPAATF